MINLGISQLNSGKYVGWNGTKVFCFRFFGQKGFTVNGFYHNVDMFLISIAGAYFCCVFFMIVRSLCDMFLFQVFEPSFLVFVWVA